MMNFTTMNLEDHGIEEGDLILLRCHDISAAVAVMDDYGDAVFYDIDPSNDHPLHWSPDQEDADFEVLV